MCRSISFYYLNVTNKTFKYQHCINCVLSLIATMLSMESPFGDSIIILVNHFLMNKSLDPLFGGWFEGKG